MWSFLKLKVGYYFLDVYGCYCLFFLYLLVVNDFCDDRRIFLVYLFFVGFCFGFCCFFLYLYKINFFVCGYMVFNCLDIC